MHKTNGIEVGRLLLLADLAFAPQVGMQAPIRLIWAKLDKLPANNPV
ncbi:MAG: hypothetical protein SGI94_22140 [Saprospiraceae bacterium]|nr:hypothetical protein [Saprospiraceae bacterium]